MLDTKLLLYIQDRSNSFLNPIMIFVTNFGNAVWFTVGFCLWLGGIAPAAGKFILITLFAFWGLTSLVLKPLIGRKRAYHQIPGLIAIIPEPKDKAFPSAHAAMANAGAFAIMLRMPVGIGVAAIIFETLIGFSRMYVGAYVPCG